MGWKAVIEKETLYCLYVHVYICVCDDVRWLEADEIDFSSASLAIK